MPPTLEVYRLDKLSRDALDAPDAAALWAGH